MTILGSKRFGGGGSGTCLGQGTLAFFGLGSTPGEAFADVSTIFNTLCTFYFLALFPRTVWGRRMNWTNWAWLVGASGKSRESIKAAGRFIRSDLRTSSVVTLLLWRDNTISKKHFLLFSIQNFGHCNRDMLLLRTK